MALKLFPEGLVTGTAPAELTGVKAKATQPASQMQFTADDINKLEIYLNTLEQDKLGTSSQLMFLFILTLG